MGAHQENQLLQVHQLLPCITPLKKTRFEQRAHKLNNYIWSFVQHKMTCVSPHETSDDPKNNDESPASHSTGLIWWRLLPSNPYPSDIISAKYACDKQIENGKLTYILAIKNKSLFKYITVHISYQKQILIYVTNLFLRIIDLGPSSRSPKFDDWDPTKIKR